MVPLNLTYLHFLQHSFFEYLFNLCYNSVLIGAFDGQWRGSFHFFPNVQQFKAGRNNIIVKSISWNTFNTPNNVECYMTTKKLFIKNISK